MMASLAVLMCYGPVESGESGDLWEELAAIGFGWDILLCIGGDFSIVHFPIER